MSGEGFEFCFGEPEEQNATEVIDDDEANCCNVVSALGEFERLDDVCDVWSAAFPSERQVRLTVTDDITLAYQVAPRVASLEGHQEPQDIVPGKYLGGLKVWSCAPDLCRLLSQRLHIRDLLRGNNAHVLEVGCGQALPAMTALKLGAKNVTLHDFNKEVVELCAKPNIGASCRECLGTRVRCGFGDWNAFQPPELFDVILGSDVTYDPIACKKVTSLINRVLRPGGVALIATKDYYFGTNGGVEEFLDGIRRYGTLVVANDSIARFGDERELKRCIIEVRKVK